MVIKNSTVILDGFESMVLFSSYVRHCARSLNSQRALLVGTGGLRPFGIIEESTPLYNAN